MVAVCLASGNPTGATLNGVFALINGIAAAGNYVLRGHRVQLKEQRRQAARQFLIDATIGHD